MSAKTVTQSQSIERFVIEARLLGLEKTMHRRKRKEREYAVEVTLSDESKFTVYRTIKDFAKFHSKLVSTFPIQAGHFSEAEKVIPDCPIRRTPFGIKRVIKNDRAFEKLLNFYVKELPALPVTIIKSGFITAFFQLRTSDFQLPKDSEYETEKEHNNNESKTQPKHIGEISHPMILTTYIAVADFVSPDGVTPVFSFKKGSRLQVIQKNQSGWWMVDSQGIKGWAPASHLIPLDEEDSMKEWEDNQRLIGSEKVGSRYIAASAYEAAQDDELSLVRGAVVKLIKKQVNGWWLVHYNGQDGFVPASLLQRFDRRQGTVYVKKIKRGYVSRKSTRVAPTVRPKWMKEQENPSETDDCKNLALYQCTKQFIGSPKSDEINLYQGETVKLLSKNTSGWWYVEDEHRRTGWVPASHLRVILDQTHKQQCQSEDLPTLTSLIGSVHIANRPHVAQKEDELSVDEGDMVTIVQISEDGWWSVRSQIDGREGLVPSVCLTPETDKDSSNQGHLSQAHSTTDVFDDTTSYDDSEFYHVVTRDYHKQAQDELDVFEGEIARIIDNTHGDTCYVNVNGHEGWLPTALLSPLTSDVDTQVLSPWSGSSLSVVTTESDDAGKDVAEDTQSYSPPIPPRPSFLTSSKTHSLSSLARLHRSESHSSSGSSGTSAWNWEGDDDTPSFGGILIESQSMEELEPAGV